MEPMGTVESVKAVPEIFATISKQIVEIKTSLKIVLSFSTRTPTARDKSQKSVRKNLKQHEKPNDCTAIADHIRKL